MFVNTCLKPVGVHTFPIVIRCKRGRRMKAIYALFQAYLHEFICVTIIIVSSDENSQALCSHAIVVRGDMEVYSKYSRLVTDIVKDAVPLFEKSSIDEFYVDLTGLDKFFGCKLFTDELKRKVIQNSGLPVSYGLASNKLISKVATNEVKPNGQIEMPFGNEKSFLALLSIMKIPGTSKEPGINC